MRLFNPESTHWYTRDGQPMHTVKDRKGNDRPTDLRDARKFGLLPSVTNVLGVIAREQLTQWKMEQAVLAALTLPRENNETVDAFATRVAEDANSRVKAAAEFGTAFHAAAQRVALNPLELGHSEPLYPWLRDYRDWFAQVCERLIFTEKVLVSPESGYAGTADLCMVHKQYGLCLVDIKTQSFKATAMPRVYPSWLYQLAAYSQALRGDYTLINVIVNASEPEPVIEHVWNKESGSLGWEVFQAAHLIWRNEKKYDPTNPGKVLLDSQGVEIGI